MPSKSATSASPKAATITTAWPAACERPGAAAWLAWPSPSLSARRREEGAARRRRRGARADPLAPSNWLLDLLEEDGRRREGPTSRARGSGPATSARARAVLAQKARGRRRAGFEGISMVCTTRPLGSRALRACFGVRNGEASSTGACGSVGRSSREARDRAGQDRDNRLRSSGPAHARSARPGDGPRGSSTGAGSAWDGLRMVTCTRARPWSEERWHGDRREQQRDRRANQCGRPEVLRRRRPSDGQPGPV